MNMDSQCLWEKGGSVDINPISVVLQQVSSRKKESLLACVCESCGKGVEAATESGYFTERLVEWFHQKYLKNLMERRGEAEITSSLQEELERSMQELTRYGKKKGSVEIHYCGILIRNTQCWVFQSGRTPLLLFNRRYNKAHVKNVMLPQKASVWEGRVQKNIGLLLCSEAFYKVFNHEEVLNVLFTDKRYDEERLGKRLKELWREGEARGQETAGVIFVRTY